MQLSFLKFLLMKRVELIGYDEVPIVLDQAAIFSNLSALFCRISWMWAAFKLKTDTKAQLNFKSSL